MSTPATTDLGNLTSRLPDPNLFIPEFGEIAGALSKATANGSIPRTTINLVQLRAGQIIGNTSHTVRVTGDLRMAGEPEERITAVASWRDAPYFTGAERVALELTEAVLTPNPSGSASPTSCAPGHRPTTTTRPSGRSPWRSARCASSSPSPSSASRSLARKRVGVGNARQPRGEDTQPCLTPGTNAQSWPVYAQSTSGSSRPQTCAESAGNSVTCRYGSRRVIGARSR